jgi:dienelactone hydrolase
MKRACWFLAAFGLIALTSLSALSQYAPPPAEKVDRAVLKTIEDRTDRLERQLDGLRKKGVKDPFLADIEIFHKAAKYIVSHNEFYNKDSAAWTLAMLDRGLLRASQQSRGEAPWMFMPGFTSVRAYRSQIDGSVQPYAVTLPADYGKAPTKKWRLDVVLHGRDKALTEVSFLNAHSTDNPAPKDLNHIEIAIYGRGNNAYRWAGETDVNEVIDSFLEVERFLSRGVLIDPARFVLRGFSMGGAGTWHLGLHQPGRWSVIGPGAGFTTTHGYVKDLPKQLPSYQEACLSIYDAVDYAENASMVPVVAYSGSEDAQMAAARNIEERLKPLGIAMTHLVAEGLKHEFPVEWKKKAEAEYAKHAAKGRESYPKKVSFMTYTLKYPTCDWVNIFGLEKHYQKAFVEAESGSAGYTVKTGNVRALVIRLGAGAGATPVPVHIDGQKLVVTPQPSDGADFLYMERRDGKWRSVLFEKLATDRLRQPQKSVGCTGPIDDAFMSPFLCVQGTGTAWHKGTDAYAYANLERFKEEWSKYMRGELPIKNDKDVTPEDLASKHLILFGDPGSNSLIDQALSGLPLQWTSEKITWNGKEYASAEHMPVLIYPSPLNPGRYIVLNSGHTFRGEEFIKTNAMLFPRLGDHALLKWIGDEKKPLAVEVLTAGLFDDFWRMQPQ